MDQVACYGSGVRQQRHAPSRQRLAQFGLFEQSVDSKPHERATSSANPFGWWKSGLQGGCRSPQYESLPLLIFDDRGQSDPQVTSVTQFSQCSKRTADWSSSPSSPRRTEILGARPISAGDIPSR